MVILHLLSSNSFSGAENIVCQIYHLFEADDNMKLVYCSPDGPIRKSLEERHVLFEPISKLSIPEIRRVIKKVAPDIIHAHDMKASFFSALVADKKIKIISHIHSSSKEMQSINPYSLAYFSRQTRFSHVFWVSPSGLGKYRFQATIESKSSVLRNIIDDTVIYAKAKEGDPNSTDIVYIGRFCTQKNPLRLLEVISLATKYKPELQCVLIGEGALREEIEREILRLGLEKNVTLTGYLGNPMPYLKSAKVMLLTSLREGTPMCALEAMALGVPIVSTPTDGLVDLIRNGKTGFLSDDNTVLAKRLSEQCTNRELRQSFSLAEKQFFKEINDIEKYKNDLVQAYFE